MKSSLLALLVLSACHAPPRAAPTTTPTVVAEDFGCWNGGEVVFRETTRSLRDGATEVLTIHETGAWTLEGGRRERRGCLAAEQVSLLEERLATIRRAAPDAPTCAGAPTYDSLVEVPGVGAISYRWPCASGPDEATASGIETARDLTWRDRT